MIRVHNEERLSPAQMQAISEASSEIRFEAENREQLYEWPGRTLVEQEDVSLNREGNGVVRRYFAAMTGLRRG